VTRFAVIGAGETSRVGRAVGVPAVDQLGRAQRADDHGEHANQIGAAAGPAAAADVPVDGGDVHRAAGRVV
jgi:hypothetical protein